MLFTLSYCFLIILRIANKIDIIILYFEDFFTNISFKISVSIRYSL